MIRDKTWLWCTLNSQWLFFPCHCRYLWVSGLHQILSTDFLYPLRWPDTDIAVWDNRRYETLPFHLFKSGNKNQFQSITLKQHLNKHLWDIGRIFSCLVLNISAATTLATEELIGETSFIFLSCKRWKNICVLWLSNVLKQFHLSIRDPMQIYQGVASK